MTEISTLLTCLHTLISATHLRQLQIISLAMLSMSGRVTMLGLSRWTQKGGSYRTIQRFFSEKIPWDALNLALVSFCLDQKSGVVLIAGDATTVTKSGKETFGLGKFFSSIYSRAVPGLSFQCLSLIDVNGRKSWPVMMEQILPKSSKMPSKTSTSKKKSKRGRPKGSKNKNHRDVALNPEMMQVQDMLRKLLALMKNHFKASYFVYDGAFGNNAAVQMTQQVGLHLISKLQRNSALYFLWDGTYSGKGRPPVYGERVEYDALPAKYLKATKTKGKIQTKTYQFEARHKKMPDPITVVIICKQNLETGKKAHIILFCTDLTLGWQEIIDYYSLRFQIEFNFRDAKQHWGLEDFMVIKKEKVFNAANFSLWMVNLSQTLLKASKEESILDLKAHYHGLYYAKMLFKILPKNPEPININDLLNKIPIAGRIHQAKIAA